MIGKVFCVLVTSSFVFAILEGRMGELSQAILQGCEAAVGLSISMLGMMCLWSGIIKVLDAVGFTSLISRCVRPVLKFIYPEAYRKNCGIDEISANFAANLLGMGNAALPLGLAAMEKLAELDRRKSDSDNNVRASADMITFSVLNTTPLQLLPTTLIALREAAGSAAPYEIIPPIYICSVVTTLFGILLCRMCARFYNGKIHSGKKRFN